VRCGVRLYLLVVCGGLTDCSSEPLLSLKRVFPPLPGLRIGRSVRTKNVMNVLLKNMLDCCTGAVVFFLFGYVVVDQSRATLLTLLVICLVHSVARVRDVDSMWDADSPFGGDCVFLPLLRSHPPPCPRRRRYAFAHGEQSNRFIGHSQFALTRFDNFSHAVFFFRWTLSAASTTVVSGAIAERATFYAYLIYSVCISGFLYPVISHAVRFGGGCEGVVRLFCETAWPSYALPCLIFLGTGRLRLEAVNQLLTIVNLGPWSIGMH